MGTLDGEICLNNWGDFRLLFVYNSSSLLLFLIEDDYHLIYQLLILIRRIFAHIVSYLCAKIYTMMKHQTTSVRDDNGKDVLAQAPLIISASRATDIPVFYADWFFPTAWQRLCTMEESLLRTRQLCVIRQYPLHCFLVKESYSPLLPHLSVLKERGIGCYIQVHS